MGFHVVIGYGPAGAATARLLAEQGHRVRVVSRSVRAQESGIEHIRVDAADPERLADVARGAAAIYNCAAPPYPRWVRDWPSLISSVNAAAEASGAVLVMLGNLYGYGPVDRPMTEDLPLAATGAKGRVRAAGWKESLSLHRQGRIRAVEARASDFFGPGVTDGGHLAARVVPPMLRGRTIRVLGDPDVVHSWTYVPDVARTLVRLAAEEDAWGRAWHVPTAEPVSIRAMVGTLAEHAGVPPVLVRQVPPAALAVASLASPLIRELREVRYQFVQPFVVDSTAYSARFGEAPTPMEEQAKATVDWWLRRLGDQR